jgi:TrwC relaxase
MLFITPSSDTKQSKDYFTQHMERSDYYLKDSPEIAGQWHGLGAELMGLSGTVDKERYFALCDNRNPVTGEQLTPHTKGNRRVLYDFTFDAPKSVSLAYELGGDDRILDSFRKAVRDTMGEMEASVMTRVRSGKRDETRASSNMVWAEFIHRTTRPVDGVPEPQLHCHAAAFNMSFDPVEEKWKAAEFSNLVRDKGYYQAAFHSRLSENLRAPTAPSCPKSRASCAASTGGRRTARVVGFVNDCARTYELTVYPACDALASICARSSSVARNPMMGFRFLVSLPLFFLLKATCCCRTERVFSLRRG